MAAYIARHSLRALAPIATATALTVTSNTTTSCDTQPQRPIPIEDHNVPTTSTTKESTPPSQSGMRGGGDEQGLFYDLLPKRQLWMPRLDYPMWDDDWDGRAGDGLTEEEIRRIRREGVTRHIILIRHGQYDETHKEDEKRILTPLGREQADLTGKRLAEIIKGVNDNFGPCNVKILRVSNMARAKETADIIASHLPGVERAPPDSLLNEGRPSHHIPCGVIKPSTIDAVDKNHPRVESAFRKYFYRAPPPASDNSDSSSLAPTADPSTPPANPKHEFEIIVCHANVIRYFLCRALQLPPEAWLRLCTFNCSLTYLTIRSTGTVSCRMLGDIGHLGYGHSTFSMHHGFNW